MAKRTKNDDFRVEPGELVPTAGRAETITTEEALGGTPPDAEPEAPSIEDRLAKLEALLSEKDSLINRQAAVIVQAAENAESLRASREKVERLKGEWDDAKEASSSAKKRYETAVEDHFSLEKDLASGQARLPFPPPEPEAKPESTPEPVNATEPDDSWRSVPLGKLGIPDELPPSLVEKLADAGLRTMGDLADYVKPGPTGHSKRLTDIPGIGQAKAEAIEEASMAFWQSRSLDAQEVNRELLEGVEEIEAQRRLEATEPDEDPDDDEGAAYDEANLAIEEEIEQNWEDE